MLLVDDSVGNRLPFAPENIRHIVVSRADPCAVGISPVAGLLHPTNADDERGVEVTCGEGGAPLLVPISPGLYRQLSIVASRPLELGETVTFWGPGVLAFDGDRERVLAAGRSARLWVERSGPRVIDVRATLEEAARRGCYADGRHWHDHRTSVSSTCC